MNFKSFWHRLAAVMTLTVFLVITQVPLLSEPALADAANRCVEKVAGINPHVDCPNTVNNTTNNTTIIYSTPESGNAEAFVGGVVVGAIGGSATTIAAVSGAGSVAGLGAAGVTSGLAAIGSVVGGGMVAGLAVSASVPVITAAGVGYLSYKAWKFFHPEPQSQEITTNY